MYDAHASTTKYKEKLINEEITTLPKLPKFSRPVYPAGCFRSVWTCQHKHNITLITMGVCEIYHVFSSKCLNFVFADLVHSPFELRSFAEGVAGSVHKYLLRSYSNDRPLVTQAQLWIQTLFAVARGRIKRCCHLVMLAEYTTH